MAVKLQRFQDYFTINDVPLQRGKYRIRVVGDLVALSEVGNNLYIVNLTPFDEWNNGTINYASKAALLADLRLSLFITGI